MNMSPQDYDRLRSDVMEIVGDLEPLDEVELDTLNRVGFLLGVLGSLVDQEITSRRGDFDSAGDAR